MSENKITVTCDYCQKPAELVTGKELYPHRPDLFEIKAWRCVPCKASVGCHKNSARNIPLGRLANAELKRLKMDAHANFDPIWKNGFMKRKEAYSALAEALKINMKDCHIGMFSEEMCLKTISVCENLRKVAR